MTVHESALAKLMGGTLFLADGGLETTLIYRDHQDLPHFAACDLLRTKEGVDRLVAYFDEFARLAVDGGFGCMIDTATWRANPDWTRLLGYSDDEFVGVNEAAVAVATVVRARYSDSASPFLVSGVVGPRGDGYVPGALQSADEAERYHSAQVDVLAASGVDLISAITMNYPAEAVGVTLAARKTGVPIIVSFTVETGGRLAGGETLAEALRVVEEATDAYPLFYMVNCAHPSHLPAELAAGHPSLARVRGYRPNASTRSHAELDAAQDLDAGDPDALARSVAALGETRGNLVLVGGCCGTDARHITRIATALAVR